MSQFNEKRERTILIAGVCLLVLVTILASVQVAKKAREGSTALVRWRPQAEALLSGDRSVYTASGGLRPTEADDEDEANPDNAYPNTPILTLLIYPLMLLPPVPSSLAWVWLKFGMLLLVIRWSVDMACGPRRAPPGLYALVGALMVKILFGDMTHGNVNTLILFVITGALVLANRGQTGWGGVVMALATALKLTPGLFLVYFVWKRQWRAVAGFAAGLVVFLLVVPGLFIGMRTNLSMLDAWRNAMIEPYLHEAYVETLQINQSMPGLVHRFLTDSPAIETRGGHTRSMNVLSLRPAEAQWVVRGLTLVLGGIVAWLTWPGRGRDQSPWRLAAEYSLILIAMLMISERSWKHHYVTLVLPFAVVAAHVVVGGAGRTERRWLIGALLATQVLMYSTGREVTGWLAEVDGRTAGHKVVQALGVYLWAIVILFAAVAWIRLRGGERGQEAPAEEAVEPALGMEALQAKM